MPIKPPLDHPATSDRRRRRTDILHPAYPPGERPLLTFGAFDGDDDDEGDGLDFDFALIASGIVTNNTWPSGYLARKEQDQGQNRFVKVDRPLNNILCDDEYYYFIDDGHAPDYKYPVIPSFHHWRFPHDNFPSIWADVAIKPAKPVALKGKAAAIARDEACRISGYRCPIEASHLVPTADEKWFMSNKMHRYTQSASGPDRQLIDDMSNLITLRRDIHFLFDSRRFTFVPKHNAADKTCCLVLHVLSLDTDFINSELVPMYHNLSPAPLMGIAIQHLFARFAWSLFSEPIMPFLKGMAEYSVLLFNPETDETREAKLRATEIRSKLTIFDAPLRSRSASPRKRQRDSSAQDDDSEALEGDDAEEEEDRQPRGRRRKRRCDRYLGDDTGSGGLRNGSAARSVAVQ